MRKIDSRWLRCFLVACCACVAGVVMVAADCLAEDIQYELKLAPEKGGKRQWITLGDVPISFRGDASDFPEAATVKSAEISFFYRYEPDWTNVELELSVTTLSGKTLFRQPWKGAAHSDPTKWKIRYSIPVPADVVQRWIDGSEPAGFTITRKYVSGGRNSRHPIVIGGADGEDKTRMMLLVHADLSGNIPPSVPEVTTIASTRPVAGNVLFNWDHKEPRDHNKDDVLSYEVEVSVNGGSWQAPAGFKPLGDDAREALVKVPDASEGTPWKLRVRAVDSQGAPSDWAVMEGEYVVGSPSGGVSAFLLSPLVKVMRFDRPAMPQAPPAFIAAKGETEAIQLVVTDSSAHKGLDVRLSSFVAKGGGKIPADRVVVYRQEYINCTKPSKNVGKTGWWPDALVPLVDPFYKERRAARPMVLNAGENESFWVEVEVPPTQQPGVYEASLELMLDGKTARKIPLSLEVLPFALPVQPTIRSAFGFDPSNAGKLSFEDCTVEAAKHRISFSGGYFTIVGTYDESSDTCTINGSQTERFFADAMSGKGMPDGRAFTSVNVTGKPNKNSDEAWIAFWRAVEQFLDEKGWLDRTYMYVWDEPRDRHMDQVEERCRLIKKGAPRLKTLVTTENRPQLRGLVDIWCPVINFYGKKERHGGEDAYRARQKAGDEVWWYTSMMSEETVRLPSYFIDASSVSPRVVGWLSWLRGIEGVLYYHMSYTWKYAPWTNQYAFGANGDGTLWYPGTPDMIGGTRSIPVSSIRLKAIRDGFEDYEYLVILEKLVGADKARDICRTVARDEYDWTDNSKAMDDARERLARAIVDNMQ